MLEGTSLLLHHLGLSSIDILERDLSLGRVGKHFIFFLTPFSLGIFLLSCVQTVTTIPFEMWCRLLCLVFAHYAVQLQVYCTCELAAVRLCPEIHVRCGLPNAGTKRKTTSSFRTGLLFCVCGCSSYLLGLA